MSKKAFEAWDGMVRKGSEEARHEIVFGETEEDAILESEAYLMNGNIEEIKIERVETLDEYAETGDVPKDVLVQYGFLVGCDECKGFVGVEGVKKEDQFMCEECVE